MPPKRGTALIINNERFGTFAGRDGSEADVVNMEAMLQEFKFEVKTTKDLTARVIIVFIELFAL